MASTSIRAQVTEFLQDLIAQQTEGASPVQRLTKMLLQGVDDGTFVCYVRHPDGSLKINDETHEAETKPWGKEDAGQELFLQILHIYFELVGKKDRNANYREAASLIRQAVQEVMKVKDWKFSRSEETFRCTLTPADSNLTPSVIKSKLVGSFTDAGQAEKLLEAIG